MKMTKKVPSLFRAGFNRIEPQLRSELIEALDDLEPIGTPPAGTDVWDGVVAIDSKLAVTELRPIVKEHLGELFPLKFVRKGGYASASEAIEHLIPQLREWCHDDSSSNVEPASEHASATV